jgi:hypothetical protein
MKFAEKTREARIMNSKYDLRFRSPEDQGTRKRMVNGFKLVCILWASHLYVNTLVNYHLHHTLITDF